MASILLCPECKSRIDVPFFMPKSGPRIHVQCPKCDKEVNAFMVTIRDADVRKNLELETEPTEREGREAQILAWAVPAGGALMAIGNGREIAKLLAGRVALFGVILLISGISIQPSLQNPFFLIACSSVFLLAAHAVYVIGSKIGIRAMARASKTFSIIAAGLAILFAFGPLVFFEAMLLAFAPLFFFADITIAIISLILIRGAS